MVAYYCVSTECQGRSRLGLDAQRERCAQFAAQNGMDLVKAFTEVETGKVDNGFSFELGSGTKGRVEGAYQP